MLSRKVKFRLTTYNIVDYDLDKHLMYKKKLLKTELDPIDRELVVAYFGALVPRSQYNGKIMSGNLLDNRQSDDIMRV